METPKRVTILENDILHENNELSDFLQSYIDDYPNTHFDIWEWFSQDVIQNKEASIERLKKLSEDKDHVFLVYTNFIGYDNSFGGWCYFLNTLAEMGIVLNVHIILGTKEEDLLAYSLKYIYNQIGHMTGKQRSEEVLKAIANHKIHYITCDRVFKIHLGREKQTHLFNEHLPLSIDIVKSLIFKRGEKVRIKESGLEKVVIDVYYGNISSASHVDVIVDEEKHKANSSADRTTYQRDAYRQFQLNEIEKI